MGGLSEGLEEDLAKLRLISNPKGPRISFTASIGGVTIDPTVTLADAIQHMRTVVQLGVAYGISAEYIGALRASVTQLGGT
jgi:hypothetical protein